MSYKNPTSSLDPGYQILESLYEKTASFPESLRKTIEHDLQNLRTYLDSNTDFGQIEQVLRESENRFRIMADGTPVIIWVTDAVGRIEFVNRAYTEFFGVTVEQVQSAGWQPLVHPEDVAGYVEEYMACLRERKPFRALARVRRQDGEWCWVDSHGQPRFSESGEFLGMAGSSLEVTERKQRELNAAFLIEISQDLALLSRRDDIVQVVGEKMKAHFGVRLLTFAEADEAKDEVEGVYYNQELARIESSGKERLSEYISQPLLREMQVGRMIVIEDVVTDPWYAERAAAFLNWGVRSLILAPFTKHGQLVFMMSILRSEPYQWRADEVELVEQLSARIYPRLEQVLVEEELRASEERMRLALSIDTVGVLFFDLEGNITDGNEAFVRMSGYSREDFEQGRTRWDVMTPPEYMLETLQAVEEFRTRGQSTPYEKQYIRKDGSRWWGLFAAKRLNENEGVEFVLDITERKEAEAAVAADLRDTRLLQDISTHLIQEEQVDTLYEQLVQAAMALMHSDMGSIQVLHPERNELRLVAWQGFAPQSAKFWERVHADSTTSCGIALGSSRRLIVPDSEAWELVQGTADLDHYRLSGIRAMQSTPLLSRNGQIQGMISTHWREPHQPTERELRLFDVLARQAADLIERAQAERELRESEQRFRTSIESLNEGFMIFSTVREDGKIVDLRYEFVNETSCRMAHRPCEALIGHRLLETFPHHQASGLFDKYVQVIETGQPLREQAFHYEEDSSAFPRISGSFNVRAVKYGDGLIVTSDDVTEQVRLETEHQEAIKQREVHHRLGEQREMERQSYAREIHDGPIQTLASLAFNLQYIKEVYPDPALKVELDQVSLSIKSAVQELRQVINELRPPSVIRFGLAKAIQVHAENLRERYPLITWKLKLSEDGQALPEQTCLALFRIYQEAVNNIIRHSEATKAWVNYRVIKNWIMIEIRDNGKGFSEQLNIVNLTHDQHFGLAGMVERAEAIGAKLDIDTKPGKGTSVQISIPLRIGDVT